MAVAGVLELQMRADVARLTKDMAQIKGMMKRDTDVMASAVNKLKVAFGALGVAMGARMFFNFTKGIIDAQDELSKLSQKVSISVESLVGWQHAAELSGSSLEGITKGLKSLTTQMFDANDGLIASERNFAKLRIEVANADGTLRDADDVMIEIADKFALMKDGVEKTALAVKIFGKAGLDMIPMLNMGGDALRKMREEGQLLNPVTAESARQAEEFNDNMARVTASLRTGFIVVLNDLLPLMTLWSDVMWETREAALQTEQSFRPLLETIKAVLVLGSEFAFVWTQIGVQLAGIVEQYAALKKGGIEGLIATREMMDDILNKERELHDELIKRIMLMGTAEAKQEEAAREAARPERVSTFELAPDVEVAKKKKETEKKEKDPFLEAQEAAAQYLLQLQKTEEFASDSSEEAKARWEIEHGNLQLADRLTQDLIKDKARELDVAKAATEAAEVIKDLMEESRLQQEEAMQETMRIGEMQKQRDIEARDRLIDRWQNEKETLEDQRDEELELLEDLNDKKLIREEAFLEARFRIIKEFDERRKQADERAMTQSEKFTAMSWQNKTQTIFGELEGLSAGVATHSRKMFELNKVAGIAEAIINAYTGISKTLAAYPYPINIAMAAAHAIAAFAQISAIQGASFEGGGGGTAPSLAGSTPATPVSPVGQSGNQGSGQTTIIKFQGTTNEKKMMRDFAQLLNDNTHGGGRLIVQ